MSSDDFQLLDNEPFDNSIIKRFFKSISSARNTNKSREPERRIYFR